METTAIIDQTKPVYFSSTYYPIHRSLLERISALIPSFGMFNLHNMRYKVKEWLFVPTNLEKAVRSIADKQSLEGDRFEKEDIDILLEAFASSEFAHCRYDISRIFNRLSDKQLNKVLKHLFHNDEYINFADLIKKLSSLLTLQRVEAAVGAEFQKFQGAANAAISDAMSAERILLHQALEKKRSFIRTVEFYVTHALDWMVDTLLYIFQLKELADDHAENMEKQIIADLRYRAFRDNLTVISGWLIALSIYTGSFATASLISLGVAATIASFLYIYVKFFKPHPNSIHPCRNITAELKTGELPPVHGREETVREFINTFQPSTSSTTMCPMLIADTGTGKSQVFSAVAQYLLSSDYRGPEFMRGKSILVVNAAELLNKSKDGFAEHLEVVRRQMRGFESDYILCIDEVQVLFQCEEGIASHLIKTLMDPGKSPYLAFATTSEDFHQDIAQDAAFVRRINLMELSSLPTEITRLTLSYQWKKEAPEIEVETKALKAFATISEKIGTFKHVVQPYTSKMLLAKAFSHVRAPRFKKLEAELQKLKAVRERTELNLMLQRSINSLPYSERGSKKFEELRKKNEAIEIKQKELDLEFEKVRNFKSLIKKREKFKISKEQLAIQIAKDKKENRLKESTLKNYLFVLNYVLPGLDGIIAEKKPVADKSGCVVTLELAQSIIAEEQKKIKEIEIQKADKSPGSLTLELVKNGDEQKKEINI